MITIKVGMGSCGLAAGANELWLSLQEKVTDTNIKLQKTGCLGLCYMEPMIEISSPGKETVTYGKLLVTDLPLIIEQYKQGNPSREKMILSDQVDAPEDRNINQQNRIVLRHVGDIDPESMTDYENKGGYQALRKALSEMEPVAVIHEITRSGLRGRGGGGFPTGLKWQFCSNAKSDKKYIICNADEGDPGAFMDRSVLEGDPHSILEGMIIGAYAMGASEGYIYCRAEYPLAILHLRKAIDDAEKAGYLGKRILGSNFDFSLHIKEGAGAFVCGEETALMASIEGKRGMPSIRPPYPAEAGLWGKPTNINNVETWANIPWIIINGADAFSALGTTKSTGTKVFALAGKIRNSGLIEVPMGMTLREVIFNIGGGIKDGGKFKAVQLGGPSGGCVPESLLDTQVDYDSINQTGAIMGSGGMVVMDETTCMVDIARFFLHFTQKESCGKCTFCRVGTKRMLEILNRITEGQGKESDIDTLIELAENITKGSLCGLGQTAPNPVLTTLKYFKDEYMAHIVEKRCPAGSCTALVHYEILPDKCVGCTACARKCPVQCISGEIKAVHEIDQHACVKCGACYQTCKFNAIRRL